MSDEVIIRKMKPEDIGQDFADTLSALSPVQARYGLLRDELARRSRVGHHTFVAELDGRIVGTASLLLERKLSRDLRPAGHIEDVAVHIDFAGRGIGQKLVQFAIDFARAKNCYKVILDCDQELVLFYQKSGFCENGICMRLDIA